MKPISQAMKQVNAESRAVRVAVHDAVRMAVPSGGAVRNGVVAVNGAVYVAVNVAVPSGGAVSGAVRGAVGDEVQHTTGNL